MKKKILKVLALVACAVLLVVGSIAGTLAYLTSQSETVTNTFTVGNVEITLDEAKVTVYGELDGDTRVTENTYKLIPGHTYVKDPTIHVAEGSEACWLFVKVENGLEGIEGENPIFAQMDDNGWTLVDAEDNVFAYEAIASAKESVVVFRTFTIGDDKDVSVDADTDDVADYTTATINVTAYAIQADGFDTYADAWEAAPTSWN